MKLEILKDNKTTNARVGTIVIVPEKKGMEMIKKGYAKDLSNAVQEPDADDQVNLLEELKIVLEDEGFELDQEQPKED